MNSKSTYAQFQSGTEISSSNLFTKNYDKTEDILTKSLLHVIDAGGFGLLSALATEFDIPIPEKTLYTSSQVPFVNERESDISASRPDGLIASVPFTMLIESKLSSDSINRSQLEAHIEALDRCVMYGASVLLYVTPDNVCPKILDRPDDGVFWIQWAKLQMFLESYCRTKPTLSYLYEAFEGVYNSIFDADKNIPADMPRMRR